MRKALFYISTFCFLLSAGFSDGWFSAVWILGWGLVAVVSYKDGKEMV